MENKKSKLRKIVINIGIVSVASFAAIFFGLVAWLAIDQGYWADIGKTHFAAVIGLPAAAIASFSLVMILETIKGNIEFEVLSFKFKCGYFASCLCLSQFGFYGTKHLQCSANNSINRTPHQRWASCFRFRHLCFGMPVSGNAFIC